MAEQHRQTNKFIVLSVCVCCGEGGTGLAMPSGHEERLIGGVAVVFN